MISFLDSCEGLGNVVIIIRKVIEALQILVPIGLILFGLIDLGKAVIAGKEDEMKKAQGTLLKRVIYAVAVFLIFTLVTFAMGLIGKDDKDSEWHKCWNYAKGKDVNLDNPGGVNNSDVPVKPNANDNTNGEIIMEEQ